MTTRVNLHFFLVLWTIAWRPSLSLSTSFPGNQATTATKLPSAAFQAIPPRIHSQQPFPTLLSLCRKRTVTPTKLITVTSELSAKKRTARFSSSSYSYSCYSSSTISCIRLRPARRQCLPLSSLSSSLLFSSSSPRGDWDGDDVRFWVKWKRRWMRQLYGQQNQHGQPIRNSLVAFLLLLFLYQVVDTVRLLHRRYPSYWPKHAVTMIVDAVTGSVVQGRHAPPILQNFALPSQPHSILSSLSSLSLQSLVQDQTYRLVTSGFLHGGIWHLATNLYSLFQLPAWLETGLGPTLFVTTYLVSIVTGSLATIAFSPQQQKSLAAWLTCSSAGICGLYGLLYVNLIRIQNPRRPVVRRILRGMAAMIVHGMVSTVSSGHVGGFLGGTLVAWWFGPRYEKSYVDRRSNSLSIDTVPADYRLDMGFGIRPVPRRRLEGLLWSLVLLVGAAGVLWMLLGRFFMFQPQPFPFQYRYPTRLRF